MRERRVESVTITGGVSTFSRDFLKVSILSAIVSTLSSKVSIIFEEVSILSQKVSIFFQRVRSS